MDSFDVAMLVIKRFLKGYTRNNLKNKKHQGCIECPFNNCNRCRLTEIMAMYQVDSLIIREKLKINDIDFCTGLIRKLINDTCDIVLYGY